MFVIGGGGFDVFGVASLLFPTTFGFDEDRVCAVPELFGGGGAFFGGGPSSGGGPSRIGLLAVPGRFNGIFNTVVGIPLAARTAVGSGTFAIATKARSGA